MRTRAKVWVAGHQEEHELKTAKVQKGPADLTFKSWQVAAATQKLLPGRSGPHYRRHILLWFSASFMRNGRDTDTLGKESQKEILDSRNSYFRMFQAAGKSIREHPNLVVVDEGVRNMSPQKRDLSRRFLEYGLFCDNKSQVQKPIR